MAADDSVSGSDELASVHVTETGWWGMPQLEQMTIRGFKSIGSLEALQLGDVNILIGPNGSGKSNFIEVFSFLHAIRSGRLQQYVRTQGGADRLLHFGSRQTKSVLVEMDFRDRTNGYSIELVPTDTDDLIPVTEKVLFWERPRHVRPYEHTLARVGSEAGISSSALPGIAHYVRDHLDRWRVFHFHDTSASSPMKKRSNISDNASLREDGSNLASFLYLLQQRHRPQFDQVVAAVRRVAPFFREFALAPDRLNPEMIGLEWHHEKSAAYFGPSSLSDGTLRFIAIAALFLQPEALRPSVIIVDEPELGLHPFAIEMAASLIKSVSHATQVIVSTQSSLLLDHFEPEDVLVATRSAGSTRLDRLESARFEEWLKEYSLGQLWEKNVIGGRPDVE
jgi:predicted ATPase